MLVNGKHLADRPEQQLVPSLSSISAGASHFGHYRASKVTSLRHWHSIRFAQSMTGQQQHNRSQVKVGSSVDDIRITAPNVELESFPDHLPKRCILFHYPETERLAKSIAAASSSRVELGEIKWGYEGLYTRHSSLVPWVQLAPERDALARTLARAYA